MILSAIVAATENNVIGKNNKLPWRLPADMKYFKDTTWGLPVIMGRKTFDSLGKALPGRQNIIITRQHDWHADGVKVTHNLHEAIQYATQLDVAKTFISGGAEIFRESLPLLQQIYITRIYTSLDGDAFFPDINKDEWQLVKDDQRQPDEKNKFAYSFQIWERPLTPKGG